MSAVYLLELHAIQDLSEHLDNHLDTVHVFGGYLVRLQIEVSPASTPDDDQAALAACAAQIARLRALLSERKGGAQ
jgi:hypothetical protein